MNRNAPVFWVRGEGEVVLPHDVVGEDAGGGAEVEGSQQHEGVVLGSGSRREFNLSVRFFPSTKRMRLTLYWDKSYVCVLQ